MPGPAKEKITVADEKPAERKPSQKTKAAKSPNQKPAAKASRKTKAWVLVRPIDSVFDRDDESSATFFAEDVGLTYEDNDPAVARAVELYPDNFVPG